MRKKILLIVALFSIGLGAVMAETDYTVARDVRLLKERVVMKAQGVSTSFDLVISGVTNFFTFEYGQLTSVSPY